MKTFLGITFLLAMSGAAFAGNAPTPAPLLGVVAGPFGIAIAALGYGAYRLYKAKR